MGTRTYVVGPFYSFGPSSVAGRKHSPPPAWESNPGLLRDRRRYFGLTDVMLPIEVRLARKRKDRRVVQQ